MIWLHHCLPHAETEFNFKSALQFLRLELGALKKIILLVIYLIAVSKYFLRSSLRKEGFVLHCSWRDAFHHRDEGVAIGARGHWSNCIENQEAKRNRCLCWTCFHFLYSVQDPSHEMLIALGWVFSTNLIEITLQGCVQRLVSPLIVDKLSSWQSISAIAIHYIFAIALLTVTKDKI